MSKCNEKDVSIRGGANPQNEAYIDTVADYSNPATSGDNVINGLTCEVSVSVGDIVRISSGTVTQALANNITNSNIVGICVNKTSSTECNVQVTGYTNSVFSGLDTTKRYFLSDVTPGAVTTTPPTSTGTYVIKIGTPQSATSMIIQIERIVKRA